MRNRAFFVWVVEDARVCRLAKKRGQDPVIRRLSSLRQVFFSLETALTLTSA